MTVPKYVGLLLIAFVAIFLLFVFAQVSSFLAIYQGIAVWISVNSTLDERFAALLAAIATAAAWGAVPGVLGFVVFGRVSPRWIWAVGGVALVLGGVLYFAGGEAFFGADGRPMRCYGMTPDGIKVSSFPKASATCPVDRTFRTSMHPMTADIVPSVLAARRGIVPGRIDIKSMRPDFPFFDAATGKSKVSYYLTDAGEYELYSEWGFHPLLQVPLLPITASKALEVRAFVSNQQAALKRKDQEREAQERVDRQIQRIIENSASTAQSGSIDPSAERTSATQAATSQPKPTASQEVPGTREMVSSTLASESASPNFDGANEIPTLNQFSSSEAEAGFRAYSTGDYVRASEKFTTAAAVGDGRAAGYLGVMYMNGIGVMQDADQAVRYLKQSAEAGEAGAAYNLGDLYDKGLGIRRNRRKASSWYGQALTLYMESASKGNRDSMTLIGRMHRDGLGTRQDDSAAVAWFQRASDLGYPKATRALGEMYLAGRGVRRNETEGVRLLRIAAGKNDSIAQQTLRSRGEAW